MRVEHQISLLSTCQIAACANSEGPAGLGTTPAGEMTPATTSHHPPALQPGAEPAMPHAGTAVIAPLTEAPTHVSATLAANDALAARRRAGQAVLPLAFGEAGLPVHPALRAARPIRSVIVTLPDNPTGTLARPATIRRLCEVAARHDLIIISDEIYRDLVHDPAAPVLSPATAAPGRTVVTTALSKSLAVGGWRIGVARLPDGPLGAALRDRLLGIGSEIWSTPAGPIQQAAAYAFDEPPEIRERIVRSRSLHATIARAVAGLFAAAGLLVPPPQAAFYVYPDFEPWREHLRREHGVTTGAGLARHLLEHYGTGVLPAGTFGEDDSALRVRVATGLLYGESDRQRETALEVCDPALLPWIAAALGRIADILADLAPSAG